MSGWSAFPVAFAAGLISFLSPCVLPLIPGYLSFITGLTTVELAAEDRKTSAVLVPTLLFVLGFTIVFVGLGASASVLGQFLSQYRFLVERIAGVVVVLFGVLLLGVIKVPWLYGEARMDLSKSRAFGRWAAPVMGMAFAAGWTPCIGPILGSILAIAAAGASVSRGVLLLLAYSLGLGVPFVAIGLLIGRATPLLRWFTRHSLVLNRVAGAILIVIGLLIFSGRLTVLASFLARFVPHFQV